MSTFREWLTDEYAARPDAVGGLADRLFKLVRVHRSRWRGRATVKDGQVTVAGTEAPADAVSKPSWALLPDRVKEEFAALENAVEHALKLYAVGGTRDESADAPAALVGNGVYVVDTGCWPRLERLLSEAADRWAAAADALCTEDGYARLVAGIRERVGSEELFLRAEPAIPARAALRAKFGLVYFPLPVRMAADRTSPTDAASTAGRQAVVVEAVEAAVRGPRARLAEGLGGLADVLAREAGPAGPRRPVQARSVARAREAVADFRTASRFSDPDLDAKLAALAAHLPAAAAGDRDVAQALTENAEAASQALAALRAAARAAVDEANLCAAFAAHLSD